MIMVSCSFQVYALCQMCGTICAGPAGDDDDTQPLMNGKPSEAEVSAEECGVD